MRFRRWQAIASSESEPVIGNILADDDPDMFIHLTNDPMGSFTRAGVDEETSFALLRDVAHLTVETYQADVVGSGAAAGPGQPVRAFVLTPGGAGAFGSVPVANYANVPAYVNARRFLAHSYVLFGKDDPA